MGIKNLYKFISGYQDIIKPTSINNYCGKKIAIDISILIYQIIISIRCTGSDLLDKEGNIISHIIGLFNKTLTLLENGIIPIYVFDGVPPKIKHQTLKNRKIFKLKAIEKLSELSDFNDKLKYLKNSVFVNKKQIDECKELLQYMGIPYIDAKEEADSQLSYLCKNGLVHAVLTEDLDILTFGSPRIIKNIFSTKQNSFEINLDTILDKINLNHEQFIELCLLFGCDYCQNLDINVNLLYNIYIKHKNIELTLNELNKLGYKIPIKFEYNNAKQYFIDSVHHDISIDNLNLKNPNFEKLFALLINKYNFNKFKIINKLNSLYALYNKLKN